MLILSPKPFKWRFAENNNSMMCANSPMHSYTVVYDKYEKAFKVNYTDRLTNESGHTYEPTSYAAQQWAYHTHYMSKLLDYFTEVEVI